MASLSASGDSPSGVYCAGLGPVLVTGGAGFIGSHVAEALLLRGESVALADEVNDYYDTRLKRMNLERLKSKWGDQVRIYEGDLCEEAFVRDLFESEKALGTGGLRRIVHLAARAGVRPSISDPFVYIQSNLTATTRLLEAARANACVHFVYASSSSVYGESSQEIFSESDVVEQPVSPYAATKKMCELTAHTYHHLYGLHVAGLRFFTVYGPRGRPDMAPFIFVDRVMRGQAIQQFGDGTSERDYTYIDDIVDGVIRALDRPNGYQIYNLGNGNPIPLRDFIRIVGDCCGTSPIIDQKPTQPGDVPRTCANIEKARETLGYSPKTSFEEGIAKTVLWYREDYAPQQCASGRQEDARSPEDEVPPSVFATGQAHQDGPTEELLRRVDAAKLPSRLLSEASELISSLHLEAQSPRQARALHSLQRNVSSEFSALTSAESSTSTWADARTASAAANRPRLDPELFAEGH